MDFNWKLHLQEIVPTSTQQVTSNEQWLKLVRTCGVRLNLNWILTASAACFCLISWWLSRELVIWLVIAASHHCDCSIASCKLISDVFLWSDKAADAAEDTSRNRCHLVKTDSQLQVAVWQDEVSEYLIASYRWLFKSFPWFLINS